MAVRSAQKITIHRGAERSGQYTWSPFVTKLEFRLRLSNLPYVCGSGGPLTGPKGKIPYIEIDGAQSPASSESLADTSLITKALLERGLLQDLNTQLSAKNAGYDLALRGLLEEKLFFYNVRERWIDNYYTMRDYSLSKTSMPLRYMVGLLAHRSIVKRLFEQGTGRFSDEEVHAFRKDIWAGMNGILEDSLRNAKEKNCFWVLGGNSPSEADATMYGFAISALISPAGPVNRNLVNNECPAVVEYATRIHQRFFPDYGMWG